MAHSQGGDMSRLTKFIQAGISQHIIQRGNNRQVTFCCNEVFAFHIYCGVIAI
jgi:hypothetical protein